MALNIYVVDIVQRLSHVQLFVTPWIAALQASLSSTISQTLPKFTSTESGMLSNHLILCRPLLLLPSVFPSIGVFSIESTLCIVGQSTEASAAASFLPMNIQGWFPLGLTDLVSLLSKGLSVVFPSTTMVTRLRSKKREREEKKKRDVWGRRGMHERVNEKSFWQLTNSPCSNPWQN